MTGGVHEWRFAQAPVAELRDLGEHQFVVAHGQRLKDACVHPCETIGYDGSTLDHRQVFRCDVVKLASWIREVLPDVYLVAGKERHGELAARLHQWVGVVLWGDARHDDRFFKGDLSYPVRGVGTYDAVVRSSNYLHALHGLT